MTHWKEMFDADFLGAWDLDADTVVTIAKVTAGSVGGHQGRAKSKKALISFKEFQKPLVANKTNAKAIAGMYGNDTREWVGKRIQIYPTETQFGGETVDCIRVRPTPPKGESAGKQPNRPVNREMRDKQDRAAGRADHPAAPIRDAKSGDDLRAAIVACAPWINAKHEERWPALLTRCDELGLSHDDALESFARATQPAEQSGDAA